MKRFIILSMGLLLSISAIGREYNGPEESKITQSQANPEGFSENNKKLARPEFFNLYNKANAFLAESSNQEASKVIDQLEMIEDKNDFEEAYSALIRYTYAMQTGNSAQEANSLTKVVEKGAKHIDSDIYVSASMSLLKYQIQNKQYGEAVSTVGNMKKNKKAKRELKQIKDIVGKVEAVVEGKSAVVQKGMVDSSGIWHRKLIRPSIFLEEVVGDIEKFGFRCDNKNAAVAYEANSALNIPEEWGACTVKVYATEGTTFGLVQYTP